LELIRDWRRARSEPDERALAAVFGRTCRDLDRDVRRLLAGMASVERNRCPANAPYLLDRLTQLYDFGRGLQRMAAALRVQLRRGSRGALPLFAHTLDRFYNEAVGVRPFDA
jgi:hypothetical protein